MSGLIIAMVGLMIWAVCDIIKGNSNFIFVKKDLAPKFPDGTAFEYKLVCELYDSIRDDKRPIDEIVSEFSDRYDIQYKNVIHKWHLCDITARVETLRKGLRPYIMKRVRPYGTYEVTDEIIFGMGRSIADIQQFNKNRYNDFLKSDEISAHVLNELKPQYGLDTKLVPRYPLNRHINNENNN